MRELSEDSKEAIREAVADIPVEEQESFIIKMIARNFYLYCERNLMIKDKDTGAIIPLVFNWGQQRLVEQSLEDLVDGKPVRYIILKARQMGISTVIEALCYWWTATHKNINSAIVAHEKDAAVNLYKMFRRFYDNSHPKFKPSLKYNTKNDLTFDVEDGERQRAIEAGYAVPGLGSEIATMVAKEDVGRSGTNHFVHGSEVGAWESSADVVSGLLQTVPLAPKTFVYLESTAKGVGGFFFSEWMAAERGESQFKPFFLAWYDHAAYELDASGGKPPYSDREKTLIEGSADLGSEDPYCFRFRNFDDETICRKIAWRRRKAMEFAHDPAKFDQEYPDSPMIAFLSSGSYAFPIPRLLSMLSAAKEYAKSGQMKYGELHFDPVKREARLEIVADSPLKIFKEVEKGHKYVIGADVAEGIEVSTATGKEGDFSVATVMDSVTYEVVARWRGHIDPDLFAEVCFNLGMYYNVALLGVEANNHGIATIQRLKNKFYRNLYKREPTPEEQEFEHIRTSILGWMTNRKTKPLMVTTLSSAIREGDITERDQVCLGELMVYVSNERGVYGGKDNGHDDTVMSLAIALQLADYASYDVQYMKENINKENRKIKKHGTNSSDKPFGDTSKFSIRVNRRAKRSATRSGRQSSGSSNRA
jgi:hypothetical protein